MNNALKRIRQVRELYRPFFGAFILILSLILSVQVLGLASPYIYGRLVDGFIKSKPLDLMLIYAGVIFGIMCVKNILEHLIAGTNINKLNYDLEDHLAGATLGRVLKLSIGQITNQNSGFKQDVIKKGEAAIIEMVSTLIFDLFPSLLRIIATVAALFFLNAIVGAIALASISGFIAASIVINQKMLPRLKKHHKVDSKLGTAYWEIIKHLRLVMVSNEERRAIDEYSDEYKKHSKEGKFIWIQYINRATFLREPIATIGQMLILV